MHSKYKKSFSYAGALMAFFMGAGFSTGQEILMYYVAWGSWMPLVAFCIFLLLLWATLSFSSIGEIHPFKENSEVFRFYCGHHLGALYDYFSVLFCYACYLFMIAAAGSAVEEGLGLPSWCGSLLVTAAVIVTVGLGLKKITEVLSFTGSVIILSVVFVSLMNLRGNVGTIQETIQAIDGGETFGMTKSIASSPLTNALNYMGTVLIWFITFVSMLASEDRENTKALKQGSVIGSVVTILCVVLSCLAMTANIQVVGEASIPNIALAGRIHPIFALLFVLVIVLGTFTASVPLVWTCASRFTVIGSLKSRILTVGLGLSGLLITLFIPYKTLVNYVLNIGGYLTYPLYLMVLYTDIRIFLQKRKNLI